MNSDPVPSSDKPFVVLGGYVLFDEIASGGMASVRFARRVGESRAGRLVAVKRLHPQFAKDADFATMFLDEARVAARIKHPNVVGTVEVVSLDHEILLVMEYVDGVSFASLLEASRAAGLPVEPRIAAAIVAGALEGLHAAHEATSETGAPLAVVHRDVSPHNVLVGADGVPRIIDFGVAKAAGKMHATRGGQLKGKLAYMSPEQVRSLPVTRQSDLFAAGVMLWEALTGLRLFNGESPAELVLQVLSHPITRPSLRAVGVSPELDEVVLKALAREPRNRFATARAMAKALTAAIQPANGLVVARWVNSLSGATLDLRRESAERARLLLPSDPGPTSSSRSLVPPSSGTLARAFLGSDHALAPHGPSAPEPAEPPAPPSSLRLVRPLEAPPPSLEPANVTPRSSVSAHPHASTPLPASDAPPPSRAYRIAPVQRRPPTSVWERVETPLKVVAAGLVVAAVDALAHPFLPAVPFRLLWIAEGVIVVGVLWILARLAVQHSGDG
jgi:serine/threonine-protein kinase